MERVLLVLHSQQDLARLLAPMGLIPQLQAFLLLL